MADEIDYFEGKRSDRTYISKAFPESELLEPEKQRKLRILSKVIDQANQHEFVTIKKETVIRVTPGERQEVKVLFYEDDRNIKSIMVQRFTRKDGKPHKTSFSFQGEEIEKLFNVFRLVKYMDLRSEDKERFDDRVVNEWLITVDEKKQYFRDNIEIVEEILKTELTKSDVIALAYRKDQLRIFKNLLIDKSFFETRKRETGKKREEDVWQEYFESNPWIFGYGLNFIFTSPLDNRKLEQITSGHSFFQGGKRVDALLKTLGFINSLCFVEIKTHKTPLLAQGKPYRAECWSISNELAGSIAQIQKTVQKAISEIKPKIEMHGKMGTPTGEVAYLYNPKSYIVIGTLEEFSTEAGINEQKFSSFEIFRRNVVNPEILTFDELYERAKFIVEHSGQGTCQHVETDESDVPF
jgi:hypothetical protein